MPATDYRLVSYATRQDDATQDNAARAGILFDNSVTDARTVLGPEATSVLGILRDWDNASRRLEGFDGSRMPSRSTASRSPRRCFIRHVLLRGRELLGPPA